MKMSQLFDGAREIEVKLGEAMRSTQPLMKMETILVCKPLSRKSGILISKRWLLCVLDVRQFRFPGKKVSGE